jgi:outer membrane protein, heavy metal efflux system
MMTPYVRGLAACLGLVGCASVLAQPQAPTDRDLPDLSLRQAVALALQHNPQLRSFAYELRAQDARVAAAGLKPPIELGFQLEDFAGSGDLGRFESAQVTLSLSQVIELGGKRELRVNSAQAARDALDVAQQSRQLDVVAEVGRRFIHVAADQEQLRMTRLATQLARDTLAATEQRVNAAKAPVVELRRARIALTRAEVEEEHAEHELLTSRRQLAAMWGDTGVRFASAQADLYRLPEPGSFDALLRASEQNPDLLRFASETRIRDAELRLAESRIRGDVSLSAGIRHLQDGRDQALVAGLSLPLFAHSRAQAEIAEAQALRAQVEANRDDHRLRLQAQLFELYQELRHAITEAEALRTSVVPEMEAALQDTRYAFERGRYSYLEWVDAQRELVEVRHALIQSARNAHVYRVEIERLTGAPLPTAGIPAAPGVLP